MEESSPGRFSQNLRGGVFIDLSNDGIPQNEDDGEYSPSELEPEVETSIKSPEETEPGEIDLENHVNHTKFQSLTHLLNRKGKCQVMNYPKMRLGKGSQSCLGMM